MAKVVKTDAEWRKILSPDQFDVLRQKGTEPPGSGKYYRTKDPGVYLCAACGNELFSSETKFDSASGWPSYYAPISSESVETQPDDTQGMSRTEAVCSRCDGHLGHVFDDGPKPTGKRYCINSAALKFKPRT